MINSAFPSGSGDAVKYAAQSLTDEQKAQARENIAAQESITEEGILKGNGFVVQAAQAGEDYAEPSTARTATLLASGWSNKSQTVSVSGVTDINNIIVAPNAASWTAWGTALVRAVSQSAGSVTFACNKVPADDLVANILIVG